ncbi:MAG: CPBP family intramembrane metalloprotease [Lachnospiraceae bacterium]|nr:CPBP family intramembrane metalloprotease [Lachnospiraceae bacterium]
MNSKLSGRLFLSIVLVYVVAEVLLTFTPLRASLDTVSLMIISELIIIIPAIVVFLYTKERVREVFAFHLIKPSVILLCILYTWMVLPLTASLNVFTLFFTRNEATQIFDSLSPAGLGMLAVFAAVAAPVVEECAFRGILYTGFRRNGSALQAIILTALLFGLFHMNLNQMLYAFGLGIFFAMLRETTGSVIPGIICHMTVNGGSVLALLLEGGSAEELREAQEEVLTNDNLMMALAFLIVAAFIGVAIALCVLVLIAKKEGGLGRLEGIWKDRKSSAGAVMGPSLIIGMALCVIVIVGILVVEHIKLA